MHPCDSLPLKALVVEFCVSVYLLVSNISLNDARGRFLKPNIAINDNRYCMSSSSSAEPLLQTPLFCRQFTWSRSCHS